MATPTSANQPAINFSCAKCRSTQYQAGQVHMTGGFWSRMFNLQTNRFTTMSCVQCGYTEMYKKMGSKLQNVADFISG